MWKEEATSLQSLDALGMWLTQDKRLFQADRGENLGF